MPPLKTTGEIQAATTITAAETAMGAEIACGAYDTLTVWLDYVKGDETNVTVVPKFLRVSGGTEYPLMDWTATPGTKNPTDNTFVISATANRYIVLDVRGKEFIKFYQDATGGTPNGTLAAAYTMTRDG